MYRVRRIGVLRTATVVAVAYAIVFAIIFVPLLLLGVAFVPGDAAAALGGWLAAGVVLLVVYPLIIWVVTALACLVYNLAARLVGGIEVEIERAAPAPLAGQQQPPWPLPPGG
jgi:hypothetical protein